MIFSCLLNLVWSDFLCGRQKEFFCFKNLRLLPFSKSKNCQVFLWIHSDFSLVFTKSFRPLGLEVVWTIIALFIFRSLTCTFSTSIECSVDILWNVLWVPQKKEWLERHNCEKLTKDIFGWNSALRCLTWDPVQIWVLSSQNSRFSR